ncbi:MAG TPA: hypothetical protein VIF86_02140, partial [Methylobacter sp.]
MSFFSKTADQDKWRKKYLDLLDEQEQSATSCKEKEDLLCKIIIRLTIATTGLDPLLDPHLLGIRDQLKNGINSHALKDELEKFTISVAQIKHIPDQNPSVEIEPLFDFLLQRYPTEKQQRILKLLKKKAQTTKFETPNQLFIAILEAIESDADTSAPNTIINQIDIEIVSRQLLLFLEGIEIPSIFDQQAQTAKQLLAAPNQTTLAFESILDRSFKLLLKIKQHNQSEQQDIDKFLSHITEQLATLDASVMGASTTAIESA